MALNYRMVPVQLSGMNTKTDEFVLAPGTLTELTNMWMDRTGSLWVRHGYDEVEGAAANAIAVSDWYGDILRWKRDSVERVSVGLEPTTVATILAGRYQCWPVSGEITGRGCAAIGPDYGLMTAGNYADQTTLIVLDRETFRPLRVYPNASPLGSGLETFCLASTTGVVTVSNRGTSIVVNHYVGWDANGVPNRAINELVVANGIALVTCIDACVVGTNLVIVFGNTTDGRMLVVNLTNSAVTAANFTTDNISAVGVCQSAASAVAIIWYVQGLVKRCNATLAFSFTGATTVRDYGGALPAVVPTRLCIGLTSIGVVFSWCWPSTAPAAGTYAGAVHKFPGPNTLEAQDLIPRTYTVERQAIASRIFEVMGRICQYVIYTAPTDDTTNTAVGLLCFDVGTPRWLEHVFPSRTYADVPIALPEVVVSGSDVRTTLPYAGSRQTMAAIMTRYGSPAPTFGYWNGILLGNVTPNLSFFDGRQCRPCGFPTWPVINSAVSGAGTGLTGTYGYVAVWERTDHNGNIWRSAPSLVTSVTGLANKNVVVTVDPPPWIVNSGTDDSDVLLVLYRTQSNGAVYFRLAAIPATVPTSDPAYPLLVYTDSASDGSIASNPILYTDGGIIENTMPPAPVAWCLARDRIWVISSENGDVFPSKARVPGEGVNATDAFQISLNGRGDTTAIGGMDEKVLVFGEESTTLIYGNGPDELGQGQFEVQVLSDDLGCIEPRSIILGDAGLYFQSLKGIWRYGRDLSSEPIGIPVDAYKGETIVAALSPSDRLAHWFACASGTVLVWDEFHQLWGRFLFSGLNSATLVARKPILLKSDGAVWSEGAGYTDPSGNFTATLTTGWIPLAGLQGFQKIRLISVLGRSQLPDFTTTMTLSYDWIDTVKETFAIANTTVKPTGTQWRWEVKPARQKCEAIKLTISQVSNASGGTIVGLAFEAGAIPGAARRLSGGKRVEGS